MEEKKTWAQNNQSLVELLGYFTIIIIMLITILALIIYGIHLAGLNDPIIDEASGQEIDPKNYGSAQDWRLSVIGFEALKDHYSQESHAKIVQTLQAYFSATHPKSKKISYKKGSFEDNSFKVVISDTYTYDVTAVEQSDNTIKLDIKENGKNIFDYKIINYTTIYLPKNAIDGFLPYVGKTSEGDKYRVFRREKDKKLEIAVDNCGKAEIKDRTLKEVKEWLKSHNFNPADFDFEMPTYCDDNLNI